MAFRSSDQLPGALIGREDELGDFDARNKIENGIENSGDEIFFFGEKQNVAHDGAGGDDAARRAMRFSGPWTRR